jgi:hypothetical protein
MSFHSRHVSEPTTGLLITIDIGEVWEILGIIPFEKLLEESIRTTGNTKFQEYTIWLCFIKCRGDITKASDMVGFIPSDADNGMRYRLERVVCKDFFQLTEKAIEYSHISWKERQSFLTVGNGTARAYNKYRVRIASGIIKGAMKVYQNEYLVKEALGISYSDIQFWLSKEAKGK